VGARYRLHENRLMWFLLSDFRRKNDQVCFEGVGIEVGRQQIENFGSRRQTSGIGNDPEPES
jgi:hypothetical protein